MSCQSALVYHGGDGLQAGALRENGQLGPAGVVVADVDLDPGEAAVALLQLRVHVVPILPVLLEKAAEIRLVLYNQPLGPQLCEFVAELVEPAGRGTESRLYPAAHSSVGL